MLRLTAFVLLFFPLYSFAAIAFDNAQAGVGSSNPQTLSYTTGSGTNRLMILCIQLDNNGTISGTPTYNGVNLTQTFAQADNGDMNSYVYYLFAPASGANTVSVSRTGGTHIDFEVSTFSGAAQSGFPDAKATFTASPLNITPVAANAWLYYCAINDTNGGAGSAPTLTSGQTSRGTVGFGEHSNWGDSNGTVSGAQSVTFSGTASVFRGYVLTFAPAGGTTSSPGYYWIFWW